MASENDHPVVVLLVMIFSIFVLGAVSDALLPQLKGTSVEWLAVIFAGVYNIILRIL